MAGKLRAGLQLETAPTIVMVLMIILSVGGEQTDRQAGSQTGRQAAERSLTVRHAVALLLLLHLLSLLLMLSPACGHPRPQTGNHMPLRRSQIFFPVAPMLPKVASTTRRKQQQQHQYWGLDSGLVAIKNQGETKDPGVL